MSDITYFNQVITSYSNNTIAEISKVYDGFIKKASVKPCYVVVDKFLCDLSAIPLFVFNNSLNYYTLELSQGANTSGVISLGNYFYSSNPVLTNIDPNYYNIYTFDHFINIVNNAVLSAYNILNAIPGAIPAGNAPPKFYIDPDTHLLTLYVSQSFLNKASPKINFWCNNNLTYDFFEGLNFLSYNFSYIPLISGRDTSFYNQDNLFNQITTGGVIYYKNSSNAKGDTVIKWNMCKGIVITSSLKTKKESFPVESPNNYNFNKLVSTDILANFDVQYSDNSKPLRVTYVAQSFDKKITLCDNDDINQISLKFWWYDKFNNLNPIYIVNNDVCTIRLAFIQ